MTQNTTEPHCTKRAAYRMGLARFEVPPVCSDNWDEDAWIRWIGDAGFALPVRPSDVEWSTGIFRWNDRTRLFHFEPCPK